MSIAHVRKHTNEKNPFESHGKAELEYKVFSLEDSFAFMPLTLLNSMELLAIEIGVKVSQAVRPVAFCV